MTDGALDALLLAVATGAIRAGTPVAYAALGETLSERAGVMNLGLEGLMLVGAMSAVAAQVTTDNELVAVVLGGLAGCGLAFVHAVIVVVLRGNAIVSGIAIAGLGTGLAGFLGRPFVGVRFDGLASWRIPFLSDIPVLGQALFSHDPLVYIAPVLAVGIWFFLRHTTAGLKLRAVGEDPEVAFAHGIRATPRRVAAVLVGGFLAGMGGAHLSLAYTHLWAEKMTAGQGWLAVGLVIIARWHPLGVLLAAYAFGALLVLHPHLQAAGLDVSSHLLAALPYVIAVIALTMTTLHLRRHGRAMPAALTAVWRGDTQT